MKNATFDENDLTELEFLLTMERTSICQPSCSTDGLKSLSTSETTQPPTCTATLSVSAPWDL